MSTNPILREIYSAREQIMAEYGNDLAAYLQSAAQRAKASGHPVAKLEQRKPRRLSNQQTLNAVEEQDVSTAGTTER